MAWHISLSHRILRERWEDYWRAATGIRLDFLSNHCNMQLYKEGSCRFGLVLTQSLSAWKQRGGFTRDWGAWPCKEALLMYYVLLVFGRGQSAPGSAGWGWRGELCQLACSGAGVASTFFHCLSMPARCRQWYRQCGLACQPPRGPTRSHRCDFFFCIVVPSLLILLFLSLRKY